MHAYTTNEFIQYRVTYDATFRISIRKQENGIVCWASIYFDGVVHEVFRTVWRLIADVELRIIQTDVEGCHRDAHEIPNREFVILNRIEWYQICANNTQNPPL
jgi:hypothetical protein